MLIPPLKVYTFLSVDLAKCKVNDLKLNFSDFIFVSFRLWKDYGLSLWYLSPTPPPQPWNLRITSLNARRKVLLVFKMSLGGRPKETCPFYYLKKKFLNRTIIEVL